MNIIDTHTHIYLPEFAADREVMLHRAKAAGIQTFLLPNIDRDSVDDLMALYAAHPDVTRMMMGLHPCSVKDDYQNELSHLKSLLENNPTDFVAIGEIGLDLYWDDTTLEVQEAALREQLEWARQHQKPFVIHCRNAFEPLFSLLDDCLTPEMSGVLHCFTGSETEVIRALKHPHLYFGIGGVLTYKNSGLDRVLPSIPRNRVILETDAPYLTPVPHRGKRNEPSYLKYIVEKIATIWECSTDEVANVTTKNAQTLFQL
jgi:TatD DNase family protein